MDFGASPFGGGNFVAVNYRLVHNRGRPGTGISAPDGDIAVSETDAADALLGCGGAFTGGTVGLIFWLRLTRF